MRPNNRTEREALNDAGFKVRKTASDLRAEGINPNTKVTYDVLLSAVDVIRESIGELSKRIDGLEKRIDGLTGCMKYRGEWHSGYEFDDGDLVEFEGAVFVAVQPANDGQPPSRYTGWASLPMGA